MTNLTKGLRPKTQDNRDFKLGAVIDLPILAVIPSSFTLGKGIIKNQHYSDFCTAFASTTLSELQEGIELSPEWQFAAMKKLTGKPDEWGGELRDICKSFIKYGSVEKRKTKLSLENESADKLRLFDTWDKDLLLDAGVHKKQTYWEVKGPYDAFDDIRAAMWYYKGKGELNGVLIGLEWAWPLSQYVIDEPGEGTGHAVPVIGWEGDYLLIQNSGGLDAGIKGIHKVHRKVINKYVDIFGAFMLLDIPRNVAEFHLQTETKIKDNWLIVIIKSLIKTLCTIKLRL